MYRVIRQATPLPQGSPARPGAGGSAAARSRRVTGTQAASAASASSPQAAIASGQPPPRAWLSGTVAAEASMAPVTRPAVYRPVTAPARAGNQALTTPGNSAPPMAIPIPATRVPPYSGATDSPRPRTRVPEATRTSAHDTAGSRPTRRPRAAPTGANTPMQTTGRAVSSPAPVADSPRSAWMASSSGGTAAMAGRRFRATPTTTTSSGQPARRTAAGGRVDGWDAVTRVLPLVGVRSRWWSKDAPARQAQTNRPGTRESHDQLAEGRAPARGPGRAVAQGRGGRHRAVHQDQRRPQPPALRRAGGPGLAVRRDHRPGRRDQRDPERRGRRAAARPGHGVPQRHLELPGPGPPRRRDHRRRRGPRGPPGQAHHQAADHRHPPGRHRRPGRHRGLLHRVPRLSGEVTTWRSRRACIG